MEQQLLLFVAICSVSLGILSVVSGSMWLLLMVPLLVGSFVLGSRRRARLPAQRQRELASLLEVTNTWYFLKAPGLVLGGIFVAFAGRAAVSQDPEDLVWSIVAALASATLLYLGGKRRARPGDRDTDSPGAVQPDGMRPADPPG